MQNENVLLLTEITLFYKIEIYLSTHSELLLEIRMHQEVGSGSVSSYHNITTYANDRMNLPFELKETDKTFKDYLNSYYSKIEKLTVQKSEQV